MRSRALIRNSLITGFASSAKVRHFRTEKISTGGLRIGGWFGPNLFRKNNSFPLQDRVELIGRDIFHDVGCPRRPANLQRINLGGFPQSEMHAEIVLRKIASATVDLFRLSYACGNDFQLGANGDTVAFGSCQL